MLGGRLADRWREDSGMKWLRVVDKQIDMEGLADDVFNAKVRNGQQTEGN